MRILCNHQKPQTHKCEESYNFTAITSNAFYLSIPLPLTLLYGQNIILYNERNIKKNKQIKALRYSI